MASVVWATDGSVVRAALHDAGKSSTPGMDNPGSERLLHSDSAAERACTAPLQRRHDKPVGTVLIDPARPRPFNRPTKSGTPKCTARITALPETLPVREDSTSTFAPLPVQLDQSRHDDGRSQDPQAHFIQRRDGYRNESNPAPPFGNLERGPHGYADGVHCNTRGGLAQRRHIAPGCRRGSGAEANPVGSVQWRRGSGGWNRTTFSSRLD